MSTCEFCKAIFCYAGDEQSSSGTLRPFNGPFKDAAQSEPLCPLCNFFAKDIKRKFSHFLTKKPPNDFCYIFKHTRSRDWMQSCDRLDITMNIPVDNVSKATGEPFLYLGLDADDIYVNSNPFGDTWRYRSFATDASDHLAEVISGRLLSRDPTSKSTLTRMVTLTGQHDATCGCLSGHSNDQYYPHLPTRILDIGSRADHKTVRLVDNHNLHGHYAALSHCWGRTRFVTTVQDLPDRLHAIQIPEMPQTFQDAILVSRRIGIRYLWIDSLCILQADPNSSEADNKAAKADFEIESSKMSEYYGNSYITIAGDCSSSDSDGFLRRREAVWSHVSYEGDAEEFRCTLEGKLTRLYLRSLSFLVDPVEAMSDRPVRDDPVALEPLQTRSWTLQERLLPKRVLHFGSEKIYLEDHNNQEIHCEDGSVSRYTRSWKTLYDKCAQSPFLEWYNAIEQFKTRRITNPSDTFPALSGLAQKISTLSRDQYCAGIWRSDLARGILWDPVINNLNNSELPVLQSSSTSCKAPSWSWASPPFTITFPMKSVTLLEFRSREHISYICMTLLDCQTRSGISDPFGEQEGGYIDLIAPIVPAQIFGKYHSTFGKYRSWWCIPGHQPLQLYIGEFSYDVIAHFDEYEALTNETRDALLQDIYCVFIVCGSDSSESSENRSYGLVLKKVDFANNRELYRRVGIFRVDNSHESELNNLIDETYGLYKKGEVLEAHKKAIRII